MNQAEHHKSGLLDFVQVPPSRPEQTFDEVVLHGLSLPQKQIPARFFYDTRGSMLFERITRLPEYYLTKCEQSILEDRATEIVCAISHPMSLVEFGSGSSYKTRLLIEAAIAEQRHLHYVPIDISARFLKYSVDTLLQTYTGLSVTAIAAEYFDGLKHLPKDSSARLFLFLGSNVGNFTEKEAIGFVHAVRDQFSHRDRLLVGVDLNQDRESILCAYNDSEGVTAEFNKNLLVRINNELGGHFDLDTFEHAAPFIPEYSRIEMRLVSKIAQTVRVDSLNRSFSFAEGEYIHTEHSHKFTVESFESLASAAGLKTEEFWLDESRRFGVFMLGSDSQ